MWNWVRGGECGQRHRNGLVDLSTLVFFSACSFDVKRWYCIAVVPCTILLSHTLLFPHISSYQHI